MRLRELFEAPATAVMAFGRMNPPTIGHAKLVDVVKSQGGDPFIFLSQSQKPKTDPLSFNDKLRYAKFFFPEVTIGNPEVKTIIQALQKIESLGYQQLIYVAGSDRISSFEELINKYNGKDYNFKSIKVVSAGQRDADAEGAEGMSASKLKKLAAEGKLEDWTDETGKKQPGFRSGVPKPEVADEMFAAVRKGMGLEVNEIMGFATKTPKRATIKVKKRPPEEDSLQDKLKKRRAMAAKGNPNAFNTGALSVKKEEAAGVGIITKQNTTKDVKKGTLKKMMKAYKLA